MTDEQFMEVLKRLHHGTLTAEGAVDELVRLGMPQADAEEFVALETGTGGKDVVEE